MAYQNALLDPLTYVDPTRIGACPVLTRLTPRLYLGGVRQGMPLPDDVVHLVSCFPAEMYTLAHPLRSMLFFPFDDGPAMPPDGLLKGAAEWINECMDDGVTIVSCQAGLNRSPLLVTLAMVLGGTDPGYTIQWLRQARDPKVLFNTTFEAWLLDKSEALRS